MLTHVVRKVASLLVLISAALLPARADLILANYSPSNPIKIMCVGDSITDDCVFNGAWRLYLQPLLQTNGYPFQFVGRYNSVPTGSFTQTAHEGFCGAVVAPPGVFSVHGYPTVDCYLQKTVSDALTSNIPDLVLILIGANDIGRGRSPYQVATNDMPTLLDIIFSNAPNANIILAKITTLSNAMTGTLNYGAYASNVPIYNATLQATVNQRRSLGQNVFLADMFSAVDYNTMFNADHLHPNALGLQAIAAEWLSRIQEITLTSNTVTRLLIHGGDTWKYSDTGEDLGTNWSQLNFDDSTWSSGPARLGYGDLSVATTVNYGPSTTNRNITTYFRHSFEVPGNVVYTNFNFRLARVDGAVVWLNGQEAFRTNMPAGTISYSTLAPRTTIPDPAYIFYPTNLAPTGLVTGTNVLAVEVHLRIQTRITMGMDMELIGSGYTLLSPSLSITLTGSSIQLSWPVAGSGGYSLYDSSDLTAGSWSLAPATLQTNAGQVVATMPATGASQFFRLQNP